MLGTCSRGTVGVDAMVPVEPGGPDSRRMRSVTLYTCNLEESLESLIMVVHCNGIHNVRITLIHVGKFSKQDFKHVGSICNRLQFTVR